MVLRKKKLGGGRVEYVLTLKMTMRCNTQHSVAQAHVNTEFKGRHALAVSVCRTLLNQTGQVEKEKGTTA